MHQTAQPAEGIASWRRAARGNPVIQTAQQPQGMGCGLDSRLKLLSGLRGHSLDNHVQGGRPSGARRFHLKNIVLIPLKNGQQSWRLYHTVLLQNTFSANGIPRCPGCRCHSVNFTKAVCCQTFARVLFNPVPVSQGNPTFGPRACISKYNSQPNCEKSPARQPS